MSIERLLERLSQEHSDDSVTPVTPGYTCDSATCNQPEPAKTLGSSGLVTPVTPVTPEKSKSEKNSANAEVDIENILEYTEERAAILEYDGGLSRQDAEREAVSRAIVKFKLDEWFGDPPIQGGGTVIGDEGDTVESLKATLARMFGNKLLDMRATP